MKIYSCLQTEIPHLIHDEDAPVGRLCFHYYLANKQWQHIAAPVCGYSQRTSILDSDFQMCDDVSICAMFTFSATFTVPEKHNCLCPNFSSGTLEPLCFPNFPRFLFLLHLVSQYLLMTSLNPPHYQTHDNNVTPPTWSAGIPLDTGAALTPYWQHFCI